MKTFLISEVTFGGNGADNPADYSWNDYHNYPGYDANKKYLRLNVIVPGETPGTTLQVTGLVMLDAQGVPQVGPNDTVQPPCPPCC